MTYEFTDLKAGDVLEVKANIVDENTLLATSIKMANLSLRVCVEFEAVLAEVNYDERLVTFESEAWTGTVCVGARLSDADYACLSLEDFVAGETVYVKGHPVAGEDGLLNVCLMQKVD